MNLETIEQFKEAIFYLYKNMDKGISEEDDKLLNYLNENPDSLKFAIEVINSDDDDNDLEILFQSAIIISNFIRNNWESFDQDCKGVLLTALVKFVTNSTELNAAVNKALVCISLIIAFEFSLFEEIFQNIPSQYQLDLMIILIEELDDKKKDDIGYDECLKFICPMVIQMLENLPLSIEFLKLSKAALLCFVSNSLYEPFMEKFEEVINEPAYFPYCVNIIYTMLLSSPIRTDDPEFEFYFRIIKFSIELSKKFLAQKIFDTPCQIWSAIFDFSPYLFCDTDYTSFVVNELLIFLPNIDSDTPELLDLVMTVCYVLEDDSIPLCNDILFQLFNIIINITDERWSNSLDIAVGNIYKRIPEEITQLFIEKMENPTPGLFVVACQFKLSEEILSSLSVSAIEMKDVIPPFQLLTYIWRIGLNLPDYKEQWLPIILDTFPSEPKMSMNNLVRILTKYPELIPNIPQEFYDFFLQFLDSSGKSAYILWVKGIQLFDIVNPDFVVAFLEKIYIFVMMFTQDAIENREFDDYFIFIDKLCEQINKSLSIEGRPDVFEFKKSLVDGAFNLLCEVLSLQPDELEQNGDAMSFMQELSSHLEMNTDTE